MFRLLLVIFVSLPSLIHAQNTDKKIYADAKFYLVDSLALGELNESDKKLLQTKLSDFHQAKSDTAKLLDLEELIDGLTHQVWEKYQYLQFNLIKTALDKSRSSKEKQMLKQFLGTALNNIGYIMNNQGKIEQSMELHLEALKIREEIHHDKGVAVSLVNIGAIHERQKDYEKALEYYNRALQINRSLEDQLGIAICMTNLGTVHESRGELDKSLNYFNQAMRVYEKSENEYGKAIVLNNIGAILKQKGDFEASLEYFEKSLELRKKIGLKHSLSLIMNNIGNLHLKLGNTELAQEYLSEALRLAKESGHVNQIENSASNLYELYKQQKNFGKALEMHELFLLMRDSVQNQQNYSAIIDVEAKYDVNKKENTIKQQDSIISDYSKKNQLLYISLIVILILSGFLVGRYILVQKRLKKENAFIDAQYAAVESENKELKQRILEVSEKLEEDRQSKSNVIKYKKSSLSSEQRKKYVEQLLNYMSDHEPYLDPDITPQKIALELDITKHHLSEILNINLGKNFSSFINLYRVEQAKKIIRSDKEDLTMLAVAFDSGFNSKTSFNRVFKEIVGVTPSQFRESQS